MFKDVPDIKKRLKACKDLQPPECDNGLLNHRHRMAGEFGNRKRHFPIRIFKRNLFVFRLKRDFADGSGNLYGKRRVEERKQLLNNLRRSQGALFVLVID